MIKWTVEAEKDLDLIRNHLAKNFSADLAIDVVNELVIFVDQVLLENPLIGVLVEDNLLFSKLVYKGNAVYYCENPKDKNLYIVHVRPRHTDLNPERLNLKDLD